MPPADPATHAWAQPSTSVHPAFLTLSTSSVVGYQVCLRREDHLAESVTPQSLHHCLPDYFVHEILRLGRWKGKLMAAPALIVWLLCLLRPFSHHRGHSVSELLLHHRPVHLGKETLPYWFENSSHPEPASLLPALVLVPLLFYSEPFPPVGSLESSSGPLRLTAVLDRA